jgi:hypothetical protein
MKKDAFAKVNCSLRRVHRSEVNTNIFVVTRRALSVGELAPNLAFYLEIAG